MVETFELDLSPVSVALFNKLPPFSSDLTPKPPQAAPTAESEPVTPVKSLIVQEVGTTPDAGEMNEVIALLPEATTEIIRRWATKMDVLRSFVRQRLDSANNLAEPDDIIQLAFMRFANAYADTPPPTFADEEGWNFLFQILARAVFDVQRKSTRQQSSETLPHGKENGQREALAAPSTEQAALAGIESERLREKLAALRPTFQGNYQQAFDLILETPDISNRELQIKLGVTPTNARVIKSRVFSEIRAYLNRPNEQKTQTTKASSKPPKNPKPILNRPTKIQARVVAALSDHLPHPHQQREIEAYIPYYIGPLTIAVRGMHEFIKVHASAKGAIVSPHESLQLQLQDFIDAMSKGKLPLTVETPASMAERLDEQEYLYVVTQELLDEKLRRRIRQRAAFVMHLMSQPAPSELTTFFAPEYRDTKRIINWRPADSLRYLQESRLSGRPLTEAVALAMAEKGEGPPLELLTQGLENFKALQDAAGYPKQL